MGVVFDRSRFATNGKSVVSDGKNAGEDWFANVCKHLLPTKAGTALHYATGVDERSCQRYAAGDVKPPAYFLRALLRSPQGWTWLCAVMAESDEPWWREVKYAYEIIAVFEAKRKELLNGMGGKLNADTTGGP